MENYQLVMERLLREVPAGRPLLLHACCGPCASAVLERLCPHFAVTVFYYNPNIMPADEYVRRRDTLLELLDKMRGQYQIGFMEGGYDVDAFRAAAKGLEDEPEGGARCTACFGLRLSETARQAAASGFEWFASTLSVSPHKDAARLNTAGQNAAEAHGVRYLVSDFKKKDGYRRSIELSRQYGLYRQDYCGCMGL